MYRLLVLGIVACVSSLSVGCGFGDMSLHEVDPEAAPQHPTWHDHIEPIMYLRCTACHEGGQNDAVFDTCTQLKRRERSFRLTTFEEKSMPPGGADRLSAWEVLAIERWFEQGAPCE